MIIMNTTMGTIEIELDHEKAPLTCENFLRYAREGFYKGTIFHRVIDGFMIQGGGFKETMVQKKTHEPIKNEANNGLGNEEYTIAMARTNEPHSATSQFFINVVNNTMLNHKDETPQGWGYCVFGKVVNGQDVVDAIKSVETGSRFPHRDVPLDNIVIESVEVVDEPEY